MSIVETGEAFQAHSIPSCCVIAPDLDIYTVHDEDSLP